MIHKLHHMAFRCKDSEETRAFYEDFLGLPLAGSLEINVTKTGRETAVLHTFYEMEDQSYIAFFEDPETPFDFKNQRDFDLHIAVEVEHDRLKPMLEKAQALGMETRGVSDHQFIESIYFRDPNGYVVELTAKMPDHDEMMNPEKNHARQILDKWQASKGGSE